MNNRRSYTAPIIMLLVILVVTLGCVPSISAGDDSMLSATSPVFVYGIFPVLLIGEGWVYFLIRKDVRGRGWVWLHVGCMLLVCLSFFVSSLMIGYLRGHHHLSLRVVRNILAGYRYCRLGLFWGGLIFGQFVFIKVLLENFYERRSEPMEDQQGASAHVLDDIEE